uniref:Uncharacterized protein C2orf42 n=2 Tax=Cacopsylla melanoneura TaxID=428564 RepID=A0A8D9A7J6_9HEMI
MDPDPKKIKSLLQGLGKSTNRGIKKCSKCGTYNGTRGVFCKNVLCATILKNTDDQNFKDLVKACKLITDNDTHIYSVRINDKDTDQRGFVQLVKTSNTFQGLGLASNQQSLGLTNHSQGLCFVDDCPQTFVSSVLKVHEKDETSTEKLTTPCQHIEVAKTCEVSTTAIPLNPMIIDSMELSSNIKEGLWNLLSENLSTAGSVVQRISKSMFAVKCKTSSKHPLGFLHLTLFNNVKHKNKPDYRHYCTCPPEDKDVTSSSSTEDPNELKCVHYFAVICSFASDQKLSQEFSHFMESEQMLTLLVNQYLPSEDYSDQLVVSIFNVSPEILAAADNVSMSQEFETVELRAFSESGNPGDLKVLSQDDINSVYTYLAMDNTGTEKQPIHTGVESALIDDSQPRNILVTEDALSILKTPDNIMNTQADLGQQQANLDKPIEILLTNSSTVEEFKSKKRKDKTNNSEVKPKHTKLVNSKPISEMDSHKRLVKYVGKKLSLKSLDLMAEHMKREENVTSDFLRWIGSISERIYLEMHYQFECNKPKTLVFFPTPMNFFECLRERIATLGPKRRLPNSTLAFICKTPPVGTFTKFVWQLTSVIHVKQVLDNPTFPLKLTRSFVDAGDGKFNPLEPSEPDPVESTPETGHFTKIKPFELITYLKVGKTSPNQFEPTPFTVEFIPDLLPVSRMGELKISFEYGHLRPMHNK